MAWPLKEDDADEPMRIASIGAALSLVGWGLVINGVGPGGLLLLLGVPFAIVGFVALGVHIGLKANAAEQGRKGAGE